MNHSSRRVNFYGVVGTLSKQGAPPPVQYKAASALLAPLAALVAWYPASKSLTLPRQVMAQGAIEWSRNKIIMVISTTIGERRQAL